MNVACFRVAPPEFTPAEQDELNKELLLQIQETGLAIPSGTLIHGRYVIRVACSNHRSRWSDFELLLDGIATLSAKIQRISVQ